MKANIIMPLEENIWEYLHDLGIGKDFLGIKSTKHKTNYQGMVESIQDRENGM